MHGVGVFVVALFAVGTVNAANHTVKDWEDGIRDHSLPEISLQLDVLKNVAYKTNQMHGHVIGVLNKAVVASENLIYGFITRQEMISKLEFIDAKLNCSVILKNIASNTTAGDQWVSERTSGTKPVPGRAYRWWDAVVHDFERAKQMTEKLMSQWTTTLINLKNVSDEQTFEQKIEVMKLMSAVDDYETAIFWKGTSFAIDSFYNAWK